MKNIIIGGIVFLIWLSSQIFYSKSYDRYTEPYIPPPKAIQYLTAGFNIQVADSFWLRAVQDFDYCGERISENVCKGNSWLFSVLDLASTLDSKLEPVMYQTGGLALSILVGDAPGAAIFFDRGIGVYPLNWQLVYAAAYHALYEEKDKLKASQLYLQAFKAGAPSWTQVFAARLALDEGDKLFAEKVLEGMIAQNKDESLINRLKTKLNEVKSQKH